MAEKKISPALNGKFEMARGYSPGKYVHGKMTIYTDTCTLAEAIAFVEAGSVVLVKVSSAEPDKKK